MLHDLALSDIASTLDMIAGMLWIIMGLLAVSTLIHVLHFLLGHKRRFD